MIKQKHIKGAYAGVTLCGWGVSAIYFDDWAHERTPLSKICPKCKKVRGGKVARK